MAGVENPCSVMLKVPGKKPVCVCSVEVTTPKPKYYILMTVEKKTEKPQGLWLFEEVTQYRTWLKELIDKLVALVGDENVVWISPISPSRIHKRNPTRCDFIMALNDDAVRTTNGTIFTYGHGDDKHPALIFYSPKPRKDKQRFLAHSINPGFDDRNAYFSILLEEGIMAGDKKLTEKDRAAYVASDDSGIWGDNLVKIDYRNQYTTKSKHCVCHQNRPEFSKVWEKKLRNAVFHFPNPVIIDPKTNKIDTSSTPDNMLVSRFLNDLAAEIDKLCIDKKEDRYIYDDIKKIVKRYPPVRNSERQVIEDLN